MRKLVGYDLKYIEMVNQCEGLQNVVAALAAYPDDPSIQLIGSKIINEVAGENIDRLVASVSNSSTPVAEREYDLQLLASLALKTKNAKKILDMDGMQICFDLLEDKNATPKMIEYALTVLRRLAYVVSPVLSLHTHTHTHTHTKQTNNTDTTTHFENNNSRWEDSNPSFKSSRVTRMMLNVLVRLWLRLRISCTMTMW